MIILILESIVNSYTFYILKKILMMQSKLQNLNKDFNELVAKELDKVYLEVVGVNKELLRSEILKDIEKQREKLGDKFDEANATEFIISDRVNDGFEMAIGQWAKDTGKNIEFEETFDDKGVSLLQFKVTQAIEIYTIPYTLDTDLNVGDIKKVVLEK